MSKPAMKTRTVLLLLVCIGLVSVVTSQEKYCGGRLSAVLDIICDGKLIKRSEPHRSSFQSRWPWIEASRAHSLGYRRKRQVVSECCDKPCTIHELLGYCKF